MPVNEIALAGLQILISDVITPERFGSWKDSNQELVTAFDEYIVGEIFWKKSLGRPNTEKLSEAFIIDSWRWSRIMNSTNGVQHPSEIKILHYPSWRDGKEGEDFWRIAYVIPNVPDGHRKDLVYGEYEEETFIVPELLKNVPWTVPGQEFGLRDAGFRVIAPSRARFVKERGFTHVSFEVLLLSPLRFDDHGIGRP